MFAPIGMRKTYGDIAMGLNVVPDDLKNLYDFHEWNHGLAVLVSDFPDEWDEIVNVLRGFRLKRSAVEIAGGNKSPISKALDGAFYALNWEEKSFDIKIIIDGETKETPTHNIDCFKNKIMLEIEWSNKDPFYDRDLNNFRLLHSLGAGSVGIIITKSDDLKEVFAELGLTKFNSSTTWMGKLFPRIEGGGMAGCPLIVIGICKNTYVDDVDG